MKTLVAILMMIWSSLFGAAKKPSNIPVITPTPAVNQDKVTKVSSGDGKFVLTQTVKRLPKEEVHYVFEVLDKNQNKKWLLYEKTVDSTVTLYIPVNSWSPDNKYVFLRESGYENHYDVFKADGSLFGDGQKYLDIGSYWDKSKNNYLMRDVTGWASGDLLYIYTSNVNGTNGPSFWFVISSRKFLQLRQGP